MTGLSNTPKYKYRKQYQVLQAEQLWKKLLLKKKNQSTNFQLQVRASVMQIQLNLQASHIPSIVGKFLLRTLVVKS